LFLVIDGFGAALDREARFEESVLSIPRMWTYILDSLALD
jgi:hypothetical protein